MFTGVRPKPVLFGTIIGGGGENFAIFLKDPPQNKFELWRIVTSPPPTVGTLSTSTWNSLIYNTVLIRRPRCLIRCLDPEGISAPTLLRLNDVKIRSKLQGTRCPHAIIVATSTEEITARLSWYYRPRQWNSPPDVICRSPRNNNRNRMRGSVLQRWTDELELGRRDVHYMLKYLWPKIKMYVCVSRSDLIGYDMGCDVTIWTGDMIPVRMAGM